MSPLRAKTSMRHFSCARNDRTLASMAEKFCLLLKCQFRCLRLFYRRQWLLPISLFLNNRLFWVLILVWLENGIGFTSFYILIYFNNEVQNLLFIFICIYFRLFIACDEQQYENGISNTLFHGILTLCCTIEFSGYLNYWNSRSDWNGPHITHGLP